MGPQVGFTPEDVSAQLMRAGGAMALLMACVDTETIRLVGRWRSNIILCYLHMTAHTFMEGLALRMFQHEDYVLIPPAHGDQKPRSQTLGISSAFIGLQWEASTTTRSHPRHVPRRLFQRYYMVHSPQCRDHRSAALRNYYHGTPSGFTPEDVRARSIRAGGAMALLMERVNIDTIRFVGRWRSDVMLRYLHTTEHTFMEGLASCMVQHGDYALIPPAHGY